MINEAIQKMLQKYSLKTYTDTERALREILQEITLIGLWRGKFFEHAAFYGGTALRILYGLDRFSEDLDFTLLESKKSFNWSVFEKNVIEELSSYGFRVTFFEKKKQVETAVQSAFLKTNTHHALLQIGASGSIIHPTIHPETIIRIKIEIDSTPILGFDTETVYLHQPMPVSIRALKESSLFSGKINAALFRSWKNRVKGRDWYDLVWFLRRGIPCDLNYLKASMLDKKEIEKGESVTGAKVVTLLKKRLETIDLNHAKEDVRPFLKDPAQLDVWSLDFFHHWFEKLSTN